MNIIFIVIFILSGVAIVILSPESFFPILLGAGEKASALCLALLASYCIWLGFMQVLADCSLTDKISKGLKPLSKKLFKVDDDETLTVITMNLSANILGLSGIATPYGIKAAQLLEGKENSRYAHAMLFVLSATSLQILPTTVISLLILYGSENAYSIILPSLLTTALSTVIGALLVKLVIRK